MKDFTFSAPLFTFVKSYRDENGQMYVEGLASTVSIDQTGERMSAEAIAKMAARLVGKPLRSEHGKGWDDKLGEIIKADVLPDKNNRPSLWIKARLFDWSSKAKDLFKLLMSGAEMGLSVAGKINPGGIVKQFVESIGKYIPTYVDVDPTEVSVTDHPANLDAFCVAVTKSLHDQQGFDKSEDDDKLVLPALRYFNQPNSREEQGYNKSVWDEIGKKLADRVCKLTGETYEYDPESEKVVKLSTQKSGKEVKHMNSLSSSKINPEVANFIKGFAPKDPVVEKVEKVEKVEEVKKAEEPKTPEVEKTAEKKETVEKTDTETSTAEKSETEKAAESSTTELSSALTDLKRALSKVESSMASMDEKAMDSVSTEYEACKAIVESLGQHIAKKKPTSSAQSSAQVSTPESTTTQKSEEKSELAEVMKSIAEMKERMDAIEKSAQPSQRKGIARVVEKTITTDAEEAPKHTEHKDEMVSKIIAHPKTTFADVHKYRTLGIVPEVMKEDK